MGGAFGSGTEPALHELFDQDVERTGNDRGNVAARERVAQQSLRELELLLQRRVGSKLDLVASFRERLDTWPDV